MSDLFRALDKLDAAEHRLREAEQARDAALAENRRLTIQRNEARELASKWSNEAGNEIQMLREALDFYACIDHYEGGCADDVVRKDRGQKARAALENTDD